MSTVERWLEFDADTRRKKLVNQCLGLLLVMVVALASSHGRPGQQPLTLAASGGLTLALLIQRWTTTSSPSWRLCSVIYMLVLAAALRAELYYLGDAGDLWLLPGAGGMVLVSSLFLTRSLDYALASVGIWCIFLALPCRLGEQTQSVFIAIYVLTISGFGVLMNRSYILGTLRLMKARDDFRQLAETDALTGLENRRRFIARLDEWGGEPHPMLMLLLDVDHFKRINDRWGHSVGDQALVQLAEAMRSATGAVASARLGGEEFGVLLDCPAVDQAPRVLKDFAAHLAGLVLPATLSIGAVWLAEVPGSAAALNAADVQLYAAKEAGRHRIHFRGEMVCETLPDHAMAS